MKRYFIGFLTFFTLFFIHQSCTHDPIMIDDMIGNPIDTTEVDTMIVDTTGMGIPCDPEVVYFQRDILPFLQGSCAFAGCHNAATAQDGVILDSYENVFNTADVKPFDLEGSDLYEAITEDDPEDIMPPGGKLENEQINLIATWILQGAEDLICDEELECEIDDVTYSGVISDIFDTSCNGCHSTSAASGGIILDTYDGVKATVDAARLYGSINWESGFSMMPQGQNQLDSCTIAKVKTWIDEGAKNN
jgi:mono/diheme cytochrome c family protein